MGGNFLSGVSVIWVFKEIKEGEIIKKVLALLLALVLVMSLFGCGASAPRDSAAPAAADSAGGEMWMTEDSAAAEENGFYSEPAAPAEGVKGKTAEKTAKIIYTANMDVQTLTFDQAVADINALVTETGGYFAESSVSGQGSGYRYANYTVKIPVEKFEAFMTAVGEACHVTYSSTRAEDISDTYYDVDSRLTTAKTKLARLQELLSKADNMADIITIESAISDTEWQIENLSGTLRGYDAQVDYATLYLCLNEVYKLSGTEEVPLTLGKRIGRSFTDGLRSVGDFLEDAVVWLAYSWIWLVILAAVAFGGVKLGKKIARKRKEKKFGE